jgi:hypothetical protein
MGCDKDTALGFAGALQLAMRHLYPHLPTISSHTILHPESVHAFTSRMLVVSFGS